ncbi:MAG: DUF2344 domain-containing protein [Clostridia bacterium]|nr:DUF2344 domain-containing protein [Clostridia bacterium]
MVQPRTLQIQAEKLNCAAPAPRDTVAPDFLMDDIHPQSRTLTVRLGFYKVGRMQFISHLDLQRFMKRAFVRSGLPIWFSEGFNPHPKMVFSTPLSIGIQSLCEFADTKMTSPVTPAQILDALNPCMPDELQLFYAAPPKMKMTDIGFARYEMHLHHPAVTKETGAAVAAELDAMYSAPLILSKRSKSGDKDTDISPFIRKTETVFDRETGNLHIRATLCADNANFLNPEYLIRAAAEKGLVFDDPMTAWYDIMRTEILCADGTTPFC